MLVIERKHGETWEPFACPGPILEREAIEARLAKFAGKFGELRVMQYKPVSCVY